MWFANYSDLPPFIPHDHQELKETGGSSTSSWFFIIQEVSTVTWKFLCKLVSHANFHCYFVIVSESWQRNHSCKSWFVHDHKIVIEICAWNLIFWVNQKDDYNNHNKPKDLFLIVCKSRWWNHVWKTWVCSQKWISCKLCRYDHGILLSIIFSRWENIHQLFSQNWCGVITW